MTTSVEKAEENTVTVTVTVTGIEKPEENTAEGTENAGENTAAGTESAREKTMTSIEDAEEKTVTTENAEDVIIEKLGIKIIKNPSESKLTELAIMSWSKWGCEPGKFTHTYNRREKVYFLKGRTKLYIDGTDEVVEIGAGDYVEFPLGMSCSADVLEAVDKHFKFA